MNEAAQSVITLSEKDKARFWSKVDKNGPLPDQSNPHYKGLGPCWVWTAGKRARYGKFSVGGRELPSHRFSYILAHGPIPHDGSYHGGCVCHRCDNPSCVNPTHLFLGSSGDNARDREQKGRGGSHLTKGLRHYSRRIPEVMSRGAAHSAILQRVAARGDAHGSRTHPEKWFHGEDHINAKLTTEQVLEIRSISAKKEASQTAIGAMFGVSRSLVAMIVSRKRWAHI